MTRVFGCSLFSPLFLPFFFRNILEHCVFKTTLCIIFLFPPQIYFLLLYFGGREAAGVWRDSQSGGDLFTLLPLGCSAVGRTSSLDQGLPLQPSTKSLLRGILERERDLFQVITMQKMFSKL